MYLKNFLRKNLNIFLKQVKKEFDEKDVEKVFDFYSGYDGFRLASTCAKITGLSIEKCENIKKYLYENNQLGGYVFEENMPPHKYMREYILKRFDEINSKSYILEIGPGEHPLFDVEEFPHWYGLDKNLSDKGIVEFSGKMWNNPNYESGHMLTGTWENIFDSIEGKINRKFDLIVASHSYEHVFTPIASLNQAASILKPKGIIVLFVPNGYSDEMASRMEMTHTLYLVPNMIKEFFQYSNQFNDLVIEDFRLNYDFVVSARKRSGSNENILRKCY